MSPMKKTTLGRQKIEIKKLEKKSSKQVTFSKRRTGLFKKAAELSILCGAEIAIIVFSTNGKIFSFAHPNVELLLDRFLTGNRAPPKPAESYFSVTELNRNFADAVAELEMEKRRAAEAMQAAEKSRNSGQFWWDEPMECMRLEELKQFRSTLKELQVRVAERVEKLAAVRIEGGPLFPALPPPPSPSFHLVENLQCVPPFDLAGFEE